MEKDIYKAKISRDKLAGVREDVVEVTASRNGTNMGVLRIPMSRVPEVVKMIQKISPYYNGKKN